MHLAYRAPTTLLFAMPQLLSEGRSCLFQRDAKGYTALMVAAALVRLDLDVSDRMVC